MTLLYACTTSAEANEQLVIRYLNSETGLYDYRTRYYLDVIKLGASKMGFDIKLVPQNLTEMRDNRAIEELEKDNFDIFWTVTNPQREKRLVPIRVPLFKGLSGWRISLVNSKRHDIFANLESPNDIKKLVALQGIDWPDTDIFIANGYTVKRSVSWSGMFDQISLNRHDYFPRAVTEIYQELAPRQHLNIIVEPSVVFTYPTAFYLFTTKDKAQLAQLLEQGLKKAIDDGSFDELFLKNYGDSINKANLKNRTRIELYNPELPADTPLDDARLWYSP